MATAAPSAPAPEGWEAHWSKTFQRHYLWSPATNEVRWPAASGPTSSADEGAGAEGGSAAGAAGAAAAQAELHGAGGAEAEGAGAQGAEGGVEGGDAGENEFYYDFGDARVGFPARRPAAAPYMHGWVYPPLIELLGRLLSGAQSEVRVVLEVRGPPKSSVAQQGRRAETSARSSAAGSAAPRG